MLFAVLQWLVDMMSSGAASPEEVADAPWGPFDSYAPTGCIDPVLALIKLHCSRRGTARDTSWRSKLMSVELNLLFHLSQDQNLVLSLIRGGMLDPLQRLIKDLQLKQLPTVAELEEGVEDTRLGLHAVEVLRAVLQHQEDRDLSVIKQSVINTELPALLLDVISYGTKILPELSSEDLSGQVALMVQQAAQTSCLAINNLCVGSDDAKKKMAGLKRTAPTVIGAMNMGGSFIDIRRSAASALAALAHNGAFREAAVEAGAVDACTAMLTSASTSKTGSDKEQDKQHALLVVGALVGLEPLLKSDAALGQCKTNTAILTALQQLACRKHFKEFEVQFLHPMCKTLGVELTAGPESGTQEDSICANVVVTEGVWRPMSDPKRNSVAGFRSVPKTREEIESEASQDPDAKKQLDIVDFIRQHVTHFRWEADMRFVKAAGQSGPSSGAMAGAKYWKGLFEDTELVLIEYPIGGQVGTAGKKFPPGAMGYDAMFVGPRGLMMLPRDLAGQLLEACKA